MLNLINEEKHFVKAKISKMDDEIIENQLKKVFTSTLGNFHNKCKEDETDVKQKKKDVLIHHQVI